MTSSDYTGLTDIYVECLDLQPAASGQCDKDGELSSCFALHRVQWLRTLEAVESHRVLCHFLAPDAESVRLALRRMNIGIAALWVEPRPGRR